MTVLSFLLTYYLCLNTWSGLVLLNPQPPFQHPLTAQRCPHYYTPSVQRRSTLPLSSRGYRATDRALSNSVSGTLLGCGLWCVAHLHAPSTCWQPPVRDTWESVRAGLLFWCCGGFLWGLLWGQPVPEVSEQLRGFRRIFVPGFQWTQCGLGQGVFSGGVFGGAITVLGIRKVKTTPPLPMNLHSA